MKLCPYPFSRIQTNLINEDLEENQEGFYPCCPSWFKDTYHQIPKENNIHDVWNGQAAKELRKRMYEGDFSLCDRNKCKMPLFTVEELSDKNLTFIETPISKENIEAIKKKDPTLPKKPSSIHLSADIVCNLSCKSCRTQLYPNTTPSASAVSEEKFVENIKNDLEIVKMSSSGEVFYSSLQRKILKNFNHVSFPKLERIHIVTNGTLFNQKTYDDLLPGSTFIKDVSVSIDAASKEVYEKVRGPYWDQVLNNLKWMSQMRKSGQFEYFTLNFILQKDNFRDLPNLVSLGNMLNVDRILVQQYLGTLFKFNRDSNQGIDYLKFKTIQEQFNQSVHLPEHPDYHEMMSILTSFRDEPKLHTFLDVSGFENRIAQSINIKKAKSLLKDALDLFNAGDFQKSLLLIDEAISIKDDVESGKLKSKILCELAIKVLTEDEEKFIYYFNQALKIENTSNLITESIVKARILESAFEEQKNQNHPKAIKLFNAYLDKKTNTSDLLYALALSYKNQQLISEYELTIEKVLNADPLFFYAILEKAFILKKDGLMDEAINQFKKAVTYAPADRINEANYHYYITLGQVYFDRKDFYESQKYFLKAIEFEKETNYSDAKNGLYFNLIEIGFLKQKKAEDNEQGLDFFKKAQEIEPLEKQGQATVAEYNLRLNISKNNIKTFEFENALNQLEQAKIIEPQIFFGQVDKIKQKYLILIAYHFYKEKNYIKSITYFDLALQGGQTEDLSEIKKGLYFSLMGQAYTNEQNLSEPELTLDYLKRAQYLEPRENQGEAIKAEYFLRLKLANEYKNKMEILLAINHLEAAEKIEPLEEKGKVKGIQYHTFISAALKSKEDGDYKKSILFLNKAKQIEPKEHKDLTKNYISELNYNHFRENGFLAQQQQKYHQAVIFFKESLNWGKGDSDLYFSFGVSLKRTKNFLEAEHFFQLCLDSNPRNVWALLEMGYLEIRNKRPEQAFLYFKKVERLCDSKLKNRNTKWIKLSIRQMNAWSFLFLYLKQLIKF